MRITTVIVLAAWLSGCAAKSSILQERLDSRTGTTHIQPGNALRFVVRRPELAVTGADQLLLAPVAVSRQGRLRQYLWLALGSTIDRKLSGSAAEPASKIVVMLDGQPMLLELQDWSEVSRFQAFSPRIPISATYAVRVSQSQVERIAASGNVELLLQNKAGRVLQYRLQTNHERLSQMFDAAANAVPGDGPAKVAGQKP